MLAYKCVVCKLFIYKTPVFLMAKIFCHCDVSKSSAFSTPCVFDTLYILLSEQNLSFLCTRLTNETFIGNQWMVMEWNDIVQARGTILSPGY